MKYLIKSDASSGYLGSTTIKNSEIRFGTTLESEDTLANPAELFLGSLSACILKNVERFSKLLNFEYTKAEIDMGAVRLDRPPRIDDITYELRIYSQDERLNTDLLKKNIEKFGTIFNTVKISCSISGNVRTITQIE